MVGWPPRLIIFTVFFSLRRYIVACVKTIYVLTLSLFRMPASCVIEFNILT